MGGKSYSAAEAVANTEAYRQMSDACDREIRLWKAGKPIFQAALDAHRECKRIYIDVRPGVM